MIDEHQRAALLSVARAAIASSLGRTQAASARVASAGELHAGVFVTLQVDGELRGCIGHIEADRPVTDAVASCAVSAASSDPRFPPVTAADLAHVNIEVSVLGLLEVVRGIEEIEVGRHGLLIESGWRRGLLLPQVAPEWGWDRETFLAQTCRKAGLSPDAWPGGGATLYRFEAEVFSEKRAT